MKPSRVGGYQDNAPTADDSEPYSGHLMSCLVPEAAVLFGRLDRMAAVAQALPVLPIPEQLQISFVRFYMVNLRRKSTSPLPFAFGTIWMNGQKQLTFLSPLMIVQPCRRRFTLEGMFGFVLFTIALGGQYHAAAMSARSRYFIHRSHSLRCA